MCTLTSVLMSQRRFAYGLFLYVCTRPHVCAFVQMLVCVLCSYDVFVVLVCCVHERITLKDTACKCSTGQLGDVPVI